MQQLFGAMFIIAGFLGVGYGYAERENEKIKNITLWKNIMTMFSGEVLYKKQSLAFASYEIGEKVGGMEGECLTRIGHKMINGIQKDFFQIWEEEWESYFKDKKLSSKEKSLIKEFTTFIGFDDETMQIKMIEQQQKKWEELRLEIIEGQQERKKVVWTLSVCGGIVLILTLV